MNTRCLVTPERVCSVKGHYWRPARLEELAANEASYNIDLRYIYNKFPKCIFDLIYKQYKKNNEFSSMYDENQFLQSLQ